ncbi:DOMON-like domain-containing protein [Sphingobium boeckii]|uniref:DOMON-like domain-containing protein n=1 Tax=Sphingobium boeckii TaxID=1082345 RepID=A0A7W9AKP0_9SPHN|nr:DOMON-like domain-containing protein [Sphingobium boeckii]MBB5687237.1 hypothetical protein [Sphingobium boeckii]
MSWFLKPHPDTPSAGAISIGVTVERNAANLLRLRYQVTGDVSGIAFPPIGEGVRTDGLWQTTCFEAFVRTGDTEGYEELNFAPSGDWAGYHFETYREGMQEAALFPSLDFNRENAILTATIQLSPATSIWHLGLSAVIEEKSGTKSYWALAHPPGKPDFHHRDCFALDLPAAKAP